MSVRIRDLMRERDMSRETIAEALDAHPVTVSKLLTGKMKMTLPWLERFARALEVSPGDLLSDEFPLRRVRVMGSLAAGRWSDTPEWTIGDQFGVAIPDDPDFHGVDLYGGRVEGPSMNRVYPHGTIVVMAPMIQTREDLISGKRYHVRRVAPDGTVEATIKTLVEDDGGRYWLRPESDHPEHQEWIALDGEHNVTIELVGRVVWRLERE